MEEFMGDGRPPPTHYHLGDEASGFYEEFLTPLLGSDYDRRGRRKATMDVAGVASQRLRDLEILLDHPWLIDFESDGFAAKIQIANPVSFVAQKVLIHQKRDREDRAKDILYIHDTLEAFGARLHKLQELWRRIVAPKLRSHKAKMVSEAAEKTIREPE
ncbi:MAG: GSU2403 family nucleotidyltransferase fold protein [Bryobacteraceae bacterium]